MRKKASGLPKYISITHGKYQVNLPREKGRPVSVGVFEDISTAVIHRDYMIEQSEKGLIDLNSYSLKKYPKGVAKDRTRFRAELGIKGNIIYIGLFKTIEEAVDARKEFILNLL